MNIQGKAPLLAKNARNGAPSCFSFGLEVYSSGARGRCGPPPLVANLRLRSIRQYYKERIDLVAAWIQPVDQPIQPGGDELRRRRKPAEGHVSHLHLERVRK